MTRKKFEVAYFVCEEEVTYTKYPIFLALEEYGVEIGPAYRSIRRAHIYIAPSITAALKDKVDGANFIRSLADGSTNPAIIDHEAVFVRYLDSNLQGLHVFL